MPWERLEARGVARATLEESLSLPASCPVSLLHVHLGDPLVISQQNDEWYLARHANLAGQFGLVPKSHVQLVTEGNEEQQEQLIREMTRSLCEWHMLLKSQLFPSADAELVSLVPALMREIMAARSQLIMFSLTNSGSVEERAELRDKVAVKLDFLNRRLGLDLVVRNRDLKKLDKSVGWPVGLYRSFKSATEKLSSAMLVQPKANAANLSVANPVSGVSERTRRSTLVAGIESNFSIGLSIKELFLHQSNYNEGPLKWVVSVYEIALDGNCKQLCESFVVSDATVKVSKTATDINREVKLTRSKKYPSVVFSALSKSDVSSKRLYVVAHGVTMGVFGKHDKSVDKSMFFKKSFGVAAVDISDLFTFRQEQRHNNNSAIKANFVLSPLSEPFDSTLKRLLVLDRKSNSNIISNSNGELRMDVSIRLVDGEPGGSKRSSVNTKNNCDDSDLTKIARRIGLPEVVLPSEVRNELYVTLCNGEFSRLEKRSDRNVEVTIEVCDNDTGQCRSKAISVGVIEGEDSLLDRFVSTVLYHESRPRWNELFKVVLPVELFSESHLRLTFRHRSSNPSNTNYNNDPWAFSFLKLINDIDKTTVRDGLHDLLLYRIDNKSSSKFGSNSAYLQLPYLRSGQFQLRQKHSGVLGLSLLSKDSICISTSLCSTKLTQNEGLLKLLQWRDEVDRVEDSLRIFNQKVTGQELVKFLPDVLDALFAMLTEASFSVECDALVFKTLLQVLQIVTDDSKFATFVPVLELYIQENYSATLAYNKLLVMLKECVVDRALRPRDVVQAMRVLHYVLKFVVRSRLLFATLNANKGEEPFEELLRSLLEALLHLMSSQSHDSLQAQSLCLRNLVHSVEDLVTIYHKEQLSAMLVRIIKVMPDDRLVEQRLSALKEIVASKLFADAKCRAILLPEICSAVSKVFRHDRDDLDDSRLVLANAILSDLLIALGGFDTGSKESNNNSRARELIIAQDISILMTSTLRPLIQCVILCRRQLTEIVSDLVANLIAILNAMSKAHFVNYVKSLLPMTQGHGQKFFDLVDFLQELLNLITDLISKSVFPSDWAAFLLVQNSTMLKVLTWIGETVVDYLKDPMEHQVWSSLFTAVITVGIDPPLQLECFSESKRETILKAHGDMREKVAKLIISLWFGLGQQKKNFLSELIGPLLRLTLVPQSELRKFLIPIFFDMMQAEFYGHKKSVSSSSLESESSSGRVAVKGNFRDTQKYLMTHLDRLIQQENLGDVHFRFLLKHQLSTLIESHTSLKTQGKHFITLVSRQLELLLESRSLNNEYKEEEDEELKRMSLWQLAVFYTDEAKIEDLRVKYLKRLVESHKKDANWAEAAVATLHLAKVDDEQGLDEALKLFERGKMYERALEVCEKLIRLHKKKAFDFEKLSTVHQKMSELYAAIVNRDQLRHHPEYFRVAFYGRAFPFFLQNKVFVFRGRPLERLGEFQTRLCDSFPLAELLRTLDVPDEATRERPTQLLQINRVEPLVTKESIRHLIELSNGERGRRRVVDYYRANEVDTFVYSRPFTKKDEESSNEFGNLWLERTTLKTTSLFPGPLLFFPIKDKEITEEISPLRHALESMKKSNEELRVLILEHAEAPFPALNSLSMKLNGIIDAAVMGGTANYEKAFFTEDYLKTRPEDASKVEGLKNLIAEQIPLLETGLKIHQCRMSDDLRPLHDRLEAMFANMRGHVEEKYGQRSCDISVSVKRGSNARLRKSSAGSIESITQLRRSQFYTSMDPGELNEVNSTPPSTKLRSGSGVLSTIGLSRSSKHKSSSSSIRNSSDETMLDKSNEDNYNNTSLLSVTCRRRSRSPSIASSGTNDSNTWCLEEETSTHVVPPPIPPKIRNDVNFDSVSLNSSNGSAVLEDGNNHNAVHHNIVLSGKKRAPPPPPVSSQPSQTS